MTAHTVPSAGAAPAPLVRFEGVTKRFGATVALDQLSLDIFADEFFALLGPSGCGKTTLLRLLAGFEQPDAGRVLLAGADLFRVPPYRRPINMMFQSYALFPHLTVAGNIAFGLKQESMPSAEIATRVEEMLALMKLEGYGRRKPHELSGGQRQRVALARSLAKRPKVLLLDEPMAALDKNLRAETRFELSNLQARLGTTFVIVTHDQEEAMTVADRMAVLDRGRLMQVGTPAHIYEAPISRWVAGFIGDVNLMPGRVAAIEAATMLVDVASGARLSVPRREGAVVGAAICVAVRPERVRLAPATAPVPAAGNCLCGQVRDIGYLGATLIYKVRLDSGEEWRVLVANLSPAADARLALGDKVRLSWPPEAAVALTD